MCRVESVNYDTQTKLGVIFLLCDSLQGGCVGLLCVGSTYKECVGFVNTALKFINTQTASVKINYDHDQTTDFIDVNHFSQRWKII